MDRWVGKVAIVTGASVGIGAAIAKELVESGVKVVGLARRLEKLQELGADLKGSKGAFYPMQCDMSKEEDILKAFKWVEDHLGGVDILINNAAVLHSGWISESPTGNFKDIMAVNVVAVAICMREAIKSIKKHNRPGHIININSVAGHYAESIRIPINLYTASKYAITGMTHSIRNEVKTAKLDVKVTSISPGAVKTDMIMNGILPAEVMEKLPMLLPKDIADAVIYVLGTPQRTMITELTITPTSENLGEMTGPQ